MRRSRAAVSSGGPLHWNTKNKRRQDIFTVIQHSIHFTRKSILNFRYRVASRDEVLDCSAQSQKCVTELGTQKPVASALKVSEKWSK